MTASAHLLRRFAKFNLVGVLGSGLQIGLLWILKERLAIPTLAATPIAVEIVVLHNFIWHMKFTWRGQEFRTPRHWATALLRLHAGNAAISIAGNTILLFVLVEWLRIPIVLSAAAAILLCSLANFFVADRWVYSAPVCRRPPA